MRFPTVENSRRHACSGASILQIIGGQAIRVGTPKISAGWGDPARDTGPRGLAGTGPFKNGRGKCRSVVTAVESKGLDQHRPAETVSHICSFKCSSSHIKKKK